MAKRPADAGAASPRRGGLGPGAALASALMAANYPGDSGEDVDRLISELAKRGYRLVDPLIFDELRGAVIDLPVGTILPGWVRKAAVIDMIDHIERDSEVAAQPLTAPQRGAITTVKSNND